jgi:hypothetical protein
VSSCRDCGNEIQFRREDGRWVPYDPATSREHYLTCTSERARDMRVRRGQEPGVFPISPSAIRTYLDCPLAYKRRYIDRAPDPKGPAALLGIALHQYIEARMKGESPPAPEVPLELTRDWRIMRDTFERQLDQGAWDLRDASVEDRLRWTWQDGAMQVELMVVLDYWRYNGGFPVVSDWKTGWGVDHEDSALFEIDTPARLRKSVQAQANLLVIGKHVEIEGGRFQEVHFRYGGEIVGADLELADLDAFEEVLQAQAGRMLRDTEYVPNPFCAVCPVGAHPTVRYPLAIAESGEVVIQPPRTPEEAQQLAAFAHAARQTATAATEAMRPWCAANGPTGPFAHVEHVSRRVAPYVLRQPAEEGGEPVRVIGVEEVIGILREQGWEDLLPELVVVSGTKLRSVLGSKRKYVSLAATLEGRGLLVEERVTRFEERETVAEPEVAMPADAAPQLSLLQGGS